MLLDHLSKGQTCDEIIADLFYLMRRSREFCPDCEWKGDVVGGRIRRFCKLVKFVFMLHCAVKI